MAKSFPLYRWDDRKHGIGQDTFYRWKRLYGGLEREELQRVRALEEENKRLKRVVADQALNLQLLQDKLGKRS
ncbi:MAG: transposase [Gemmatimonadetes bacterium 13_1_40CM_4_69_8]|nr:MAG: transposase [Gemmatimonadetes bacterium 13_1_40CM_4_69_8]